MAYFVLFVLVVHKEKPHIVIYDPKKKQCIKIFQKQSDLKYGQHI